MLFKFMYKNIDIVFSILGIIIGGSIFFNYIIQVNEEYIAFEKLCHSKGGSVVVTRKEPICYKNDSFIDLTK